MSVGVSFPQWESDPNVQLHIFNHSFPSTDSTDYCIENNQLQLPFHQLTGLA